MALGHAKLNTGINPSRCTKGALADDSLQGQSGLLIAVVVAVDNGQDRGCLRAACRNVEASQSLHTSLRQKLMRPRGVNPFYCRHACAREVGVFRKAILQSKAHETVAVLASMFLAP